MITQKLNPMHPVTQPSRQLARAYWDTLELQLLSAMLGKAAEQAKEVAL